MNPFAKIQAKPQALTWLRFGDIRPEGWMRTQMLHDLECGFVGHLDELVPELILKDDIYGSDRLTKAVRTKELGVVSNETEWQVQFLWWNSETQSNWRDGLMRSTLLLEHPDYLPKVHAFIEKILASQDADGYLGIYAGDLRFNFTGENGELWAQATLLRVLLGYFEFTGDLRVLDAVKRATACTMNAYPPGHSRPFTVQGDYAGVCHGLMFTDILDRLYQLTGQESYLDYALWLYQEYSQNTLSQDDIQLVHLLNPSYRFKAHGAHTYEHLRALLTAVYASDNPLLENALDGYFAKLDLCLTPSGGPIGDEFIGGRLADASETGYEYCSIHELMDSYTHLLQKTGDPQWADRTEWLLFNAGQGARHPFHSAITYLKTDNAYSLTGSLHADDPIDVRNPQTRYKYSAVHQDAAVCCVPNAGRSYPYYLKAMWMHSKDGLAASLYGASDLRTVVNGVAVHITEETHYPFDLEMTFTVAVAQSVEFELSLRKPNWATDFLLTGTNAWREENGWIKIRKTWQTGEIIVLRFETDVRVNLFRDDEYFLSYGPLIFVLPLAGIETEGRKYPLDGFVDRYYFPISTAATDWRLARGQEFRLEQGIPKPDHPWDSVLALVGNMVNADTHQILPVRLIPFGGSILRQTTFKYLD